MAFEKHNWKSGDVISSAKLNKMEDGIVEASEPVAWEDVTDKPETFTPDPHTHSEYVTFEDIAPDVDLIYDLQNQMNNKASSTHLHDDQYSKIGHTHTIANVTGLQEKLGILDELYDELEARVSALETPEV